MSASIAPHPATPAAPIAFDDVEVVEQTTLGLGCRIGGRIVFAGNFVRLPGTTIARRGDVGRLVLPQWFVELHRIAPSSSGEPAAGPGRDAALALARATLATAL